MLEKGTEVGKNKARFLREVLAVCGTFEQNDMAFQVYRQLWTDGRARYHVTVFPVCKVHGEWKDCGAARLVDTLDQALAVTGELAALLLVASAGYASGSDDLALI